MSIFVSTNSFLPVLFSSTQAIMSLGAMVFTVDGYDFESL